MTGALNKDGIPYTTASDTDELEALKQAVDPASQANLSLADSLEHVLIARLDNAGKPVTTAPVQLDVQIKIRTANAPVLFHAPLQKIGNSREARGVTAKDSDLKLNVRCLDPDCASTEVRLTNSQQSEAGFIFRIRHVKAEALGPFSTPPKNSRLVHLATLVSSASDPTLLTTEVAWGPASFEFDAGDITASGDLVATGDDEVNVSVQVKNEAALDARLLGNSDHGDLLIRLSEGTAWSYLKIKIPKRVNPTPVYNGDDDKVPVTERFIPYDLSNPITSAFQKDKMNPLVQAAILLHSTGAWSGDLKLFLNRLEPNLSRVLPALAAEKVPPEFVFIMKIESNYFVGKDFPVSVSRVGAVGPWQFMPATAHTFELKTLPLVASVTKNVKGAQVKHVSANPCDGRSNLDQSSVAAAKYLRKLLNMFPNDPKLAVMAYNLGEGGVGRRLNCVNRKQNGTVGINVDCSKLPTASALKVSDFMGLDYWTIRDYKAAPVESINYVTRFLGAQFVGREPTQYGIKLDSSAMPFAPSACH